MFQVWLSVCQSVSVCVCVDQWSPLNPEGKKQYDRNFMLQLQYVPSSVTRPANLPALPDIILTEVSTLTVSLCVCLYLSSLSCTFVIQFNTLTYIIYLRQNLIQQLQVKAILSYSKNTKITPKIKAQMSTCQFLNIFFARTDTMTPLTYINYHWTQQLYESSACLLNIE